jgi:hypothetical protein
MITCLPGRTRFGASLGGLAAGLSLLFVVACEGDRASAEPASRPGQRGRILSPSGQPAAGALVQAFPLPNEGEIGLFREPATPYSFRSDDEGYYAFTGLPSGWYGISSRKGDLAAFRDSVHVAKDAPDPRSDTLRALGSWSGRAELQPFDDVRTVSLCLVGTDRCETADSAGAFRFTSAAPGRYRAVARTRLKGYLPVVASVRIGPGEAVRGGDTLRPKYLGVPVVEELRSEYRATPELGIAIVTWNPTTYALAKGYAVFRDRAGAPLLSEAPFARVPLGRNSFEDTLFRGRSQSPQAEIRYEYRVAVTETDGAPGPRFAFGTVASIPPADIRYPMVLEVQGKARGAITIKDSLLFRIRFRNPYRRNDTLQWWVSDVAPYRTVALADTAVADSLPFRVPDQPGLVRIRVRVVDSAGTTWNYRDSVLVRLDPPRAFAGRDTFVTVGDTLRLTGIASDSLGSLARLEWDTGDVGFREAPDGKLAWAVPGAPGSLRSAVFRAIDDDGNQASDTLRIRVVGYRILAVRPVLPHARSVRPHLNLPLIEAQGRTFAFGGSVLDPFGAWTEYQASSGQWISRATAPFSGILSVVSDRIFLTDDSRLYEYDPGADAWIARPSPPVAGRKDIEYAPIPTVVHEGRLYRIGGISDAGPGLSEVEIFDPAAGAWSLGRNSPTPGDALPFSLSGRIYLAARSDSSLSAYDPGADRWTFAGRLPGGGKSLIPMGSVGAKACFLEESSTTMRIFDADHGTWSLSTLPAGIRPVTYKDYMDGLATFVSLPQGIMAAFSVVLQTDQAGEWFRVALYDAVVGTWRDLSYIYPEAGQGYQRISFAAPGIDRVHAALFGPINPGSGYPKQERLRLRPRFLDYFLP